MSGTRTWNLLRNLLDETNTRGYHKLRMATLIHNYQGTVNNLLSELRACHIDASPSPPLQEYPGDPNLEMDRPFTVAEVRSAGLRVRTKSAPGQDGITNKIIRNLDGGSLRALTKYINDIWHRAPAKRMEGT
ncbi:hypothetical protein HPB47_012326 [Ixodes persulcatus]|uniref:Uncharacterized protein n=1 Tax=Ixodes persulcatus TaxID=34615 RepID=A0AC60NTT6_IXOPE|nr:hypothetical protein HPB47_012326 [Ixodes persulcatus]